jgi:hypothetical protein
VVSNVFAEIAPIFTQVAAIVASIPPVLDPVPPGALRRTSEGCRRGQVGVGL